MTNPPVQAQLRAFDARKEKEEAEIEEKAKLEAEEKAHVVSSEIQVHVVCVLFLSLVRVVRVPGAPR